MDVYVGERVLLGEELVAAAVLVQGDKVREIVRGCTKADDEKLRCVYTEIRSAGASICDVRTEGGGGYLQKQT